MLQGNTHPMFRFRSRPSRSTPRQEWQGEADGGGSGDAVLKVRQRRTDHMMRIRPFPTADGGRPVRFGGVSATPVFDMKKRQHPGRRRGAAAQRWPREEGGAAYGCGKAGEEERPLPPTNGPVGGGGVRRIGCRGTGRLWGAASSGRRMPPVPPREERAGRVVLTSNPRLLPVPGG